MIKGLTLDVFHTMVRDDGAADAHKRRKEVLLRWCRARKSSCSEDDVRRAYRHAEDWRDSERATLRHFSLQQMVRFILDELSIADEDDFSQLVAEIADAPLDGNFLIAPGLREFLRRCHRHGFRLGYISNIGWQSSPFVERNLGQLGILHYFSPAARISSETSGYFKPHPYPFRDAVSGMNLSPSEVMHVGDSYVADYRGSRDFGMSAALITSFRNETPPHGTRVVAGFDALWRSIMDSDGQLIGSRKAE